METEFTSEELFQILVDDVLSNENAQYESENLDALFGTLGMDII